MHPIDMATGNRLLITRTFAVTTSITLGAIFIGGCSQIAESGPVVNAKNQAVCSVLSQPLQILNDNISKISESPAGRAAGTAVDGTQSALESATAAATGHLTGALTGLDESVQSMINALTAGAVPAELKQMTTTVKTNIASVQSACAS